MQSILLKKRVWVIIKVPLIYFEIYNPFFYNKYKEFSIMCKFAYVKKI
jgi:hypothetical protein